MPIFVIACPPDPARHARGFGKPQARAGTGL